MDNKIELYLLYLCDEELSNEIYKEEFCIGLFSSEEKARITAEYYLNNVSGFKDYICSKRIRHVSVEDKEAHNQIYYLVEGWNENGDFDEIDIVQSGLYSERRNAINEMNNMQKSFMRQNWVVDKYEVDVCKWNDGFVRV